MYVHTLYIRVAKALTRQYRCIRTSHIRKSPKSHGPVQYLFKITLTFLILSTSQPFWCSGQTTHLIKVRTRAKIRNRYNQVSHLPKNTNGKVTNPHLDITKESQGVSPFPAGDHKEPITRRARKHSKHKTEIT